MFLGLGGILAVFAALNILAAIIAMDKARDRAAADTAATARLLGVLLSRNPSALREPVREFSRITSLRVIIFDSKGRLLADSSTDRAAPAPGADASRAVLGAVADKSPRVFRTSGSGASGKTDWIAVPLGDSGRPAAGAAVFDFSPAVRDEKARALNSLIPLFLADAAAILLMAVAARLFSRSLTVPLTRLTKAAYRLGQGDFDEPTSVTGRDEVGVLAASFESMRLDLKRSTLELKARLDEQGRSEDAWQAAHSELSHELAELKLYADEMKHLSWMGAALQKALTPEDCYAAVTSVLPKLFPGFSGGLFLFGASHLEVKPVSLWGDKPPDEKDLTRLDLMALHSGRSVPSFLVQDAGRSSAPDTSSLPKGSLSVPLAAKGDVLGFFYLKQSGRPSAADAPAPAHAHFLAMTAADQFALTLSNLSLRETLRQQSIRDPLTGLYNRRYLDETVEREFLRAKRRKSSVGMILIDIDHFKMFNDTYGHEAGDEALRILGTLFRKAIRGSDIACRYGGEEFLLILPDAGLEDSRARAEKIRRDVEQRAIEYLKTDCGRMTVSMGVASFPDRGTISAEVIQAADAALYRAKSEGRNRVVSAPPAPVRDKA